MCFYREKHHRNSQCDGHQYSKSHTKDKDIQRVHFTVGVQQLSLCTSCSDHIEEKALLYMTKSL